MARKSGREGSTGPEPASVLARTTFGIRGAVQHLVRLSSSAHPQRGKSSHSQCPKHLQVTVDLVVLVLQDDVVLDCVLPPGDGDMDPMCVAFTWRRSNTTSMAMRGEVRVEASDRTRRWKGDAATGGGWVGLGLMRSEAERHVKTVPLRLYQTAGSAHRPLASTRPKLLPTPTTCRSPSEGSCSTSSCTRRRPPPRSCSASRSGSPTSALRSR